MKVRVITVGKLKENGGFREMSDFYLKRIKPFAQVESVELKDQNSVEKEAELIKRQIPSNSYVVALREEGEKRDSVAFSKIVKSQKESGRSITFVIGGAYGLGKIGEDISLSIAPWTLPHQLARITLLEQIYRGFSIISGGKYHHA